MAPYAKQRAATQSTTERLLRTGHVKRSADQKQQRRPNANVLAGRPPVRNGAPETIFVDMAGDIQSGGFL
jgi:hypothetical protein